MRLDKYLKVSRVIKRRTVANEVCDAKHVTVNGKIARASYDVKVGDIVLTSKYGGTEVKYDDKEYKILSASDILAVISK